MAKRNSQLTELLIVAQDDYLTIVDTSAGQSKRVSVKTLTGAPDVGWTATGEAWTFSSFNTTTRVGVITVPSNATTKYSAGMWVRIAQTTGGTKYGVITAVTTTTLSVNFFTTQTLNNEAINTPVYSPLYQPYGAPSLPVTSTDANGWTVYDYGVAKEYTKRVTFSQTINNGSGVVLSMSSSVLPAVVADMTNYRMTYAESVTNGNAYQFQMVAEMQTSSTTINFTATKLIGSSGTVSGFIDLYIK